MKTTENRNAPATVAFLCGAAALALAVVQPESTDTSRGIIASTIGITAIAAGIRALALVRDGRSYSALAPVLGMIGGAIGAVVMGSFLVAFYFGPSASTGSSPTTVISPEAVALPVAEAASVPEPAVFADPDTERMALAPVAGTISFVLSQVTPDGIWPETLLVDPGGLVSTPSGGALATVPAGTQVIYSTSSDRTQYSVILVGPSFGTSATYVSSVGQVVLG